MLQPPTNDALCTGRHARKGRSKELAPVQIASQPSSSPPRRLGWYDWKPARTRRAGLTGGGCASAQVSLVGTLISAPAAAVAAGAAAGLGAEVAAGMAVGVEDAVRGGAVVVVGTAARPRGLADTGRAAEPAAALAGAGLLLGAAEPLGGVLDCVAGGLAISMTDGLAAEGPVPGPLLPAPLCPWPTLPSCCCGSCALPGLLACPCTLCCGSCCWGRGMSFGAPCTPTPFCCCCCCCCCFCCFCC